MQEKRPKNDPKRRQRLAAALRANLKRRKEKDRAKAKSTTAETKDGSTPR